jgi:hypothetical protein
MSTSFRFTSIEAITKSQSGRLVMWSAAVKAPSNHLLTLYRCSSISSSAVLDLDGWRERVIREPVPSGKVSLRLVESLQSQEVEHHSLSEANQSRDLLQRPRQQEECAHETSIITTRLLVLLWVSSHR